MKADTRTGKSVYSDKLHSHPRNVAFLFVGNNGHHTLLAVEMEAETATVGRYKIVGFFVRRFFTCFCAPPHRVLYAMLAIHYGRAFRWLQFICGCHGLHATFGVERTCKAVRYVAGVIYRFAHKGSFCYRLHRLSQVVAAQCGYKRVAQAAAHIGEQ